MEKDTMDCVHCHGQMKQSSAPCHIDRNGYHLLFDTVPAWVCEQCGEAYFEEREVNAMQRVIRGLDPEALSARVYEARKRKNCHTKITSTKPKPISAIHPPAQFPNKPCFSQIRP